MYIVQNVESKTQYHNFQLKDSREKNLLYCFILKQIEERKYN
jgi:hypothetical protein